MRWFDRPQHYRSGRRSMRLPGRCYFSERRARVQAQRVANELCYTLTAKLRGVVDALGGQRTLARGFQSCAEHMVARMVQCVPTVRRDLKLSRFGGDADMADLFASGMRGDSPVQTTWEELQQEAKKLSPHVCDICKSHNRLVYRCLLGARSRGTHGVGCGCVFCPACAIHSRADVLCPRCARCVITARTR